MRNKEFWVALGIGAIAGGIAALLYAPQSGAATRKQIRRKVEDVSDSLEDAAEYLKDQAEKLAKETQKFIEVSKDRFDGAVDSASDYVKTAQKTASKNLGKLV